MSYLIYGLIITALSFVSVQTQALDKVIYGPTDDRHDILDFPSGHIYRELSLSTLAQVQKSTLSSISNDYFKTNVTDTVGSSFNLCAGETNSERLTPARCSGFLVSDDMVVTAGHCMQESSDCSNYYWVFGMDQSVDRDRLINKSNVFRCEKVMALKRFGKSGLDYAVIKLDRKVQDRKPVKINRSPLKRSDIFVIGHPHGMTTMLTNNGKLIGDHSGYFFSAHVDTFGGNSGSAVFSEESKSVLGILVGGMEDFKWDDVNNCRRLNRCSGADCSGENIVNISSLELHRYPELLSQRAPAKPFIDLCKRAPSQEISHTIDTLFEVLGAKSCADLETVLSKKKRLNLSEKNIVDISALANFANIERLNLSDNRIVDIFPLRGLKNLKSLKLENNPIDFHDLTCPTTNETSSEVKMFCLYRNR